MDFKMDMFYRATFQAVTITLMMCVCLTAGQSCLVHPGCTCEPRNGTDITCRDLGSKIPKFLSSEYYFKRLSIYGGYRIASIEKSAFMNINIRELVIYQTAIPSPGCEDFGWLADSVTYLSFTASNLIEVPRCAISPLTNLTYLGLQTNTIRHIKSGDFASLTELRNLLLDTNSIRTIDIGAFSRLSYLQTLSLVSNRLDDLNGLWFEPLISLRTLNLRNNRISAIKAGDFDELKRIEILFLDNNNIEDIAKDAFKQNWNLKQLYITNNHIHQLQGSLFASLNDLTHFYAGKNNLTELDSTMFQHSSRLLIISLAENNFQSIQLEMFTGLRDLRSLILSHSGRYESVVISLSFRDYWPNLQTIYLKNNNVKEILPNSLTDLPQLRTVDLSYNQLNSIPDKILENCLHLTHLYLQSNNLTTIDPSVIENLPPSLLYLNLCNNPLSGSTIMALRRKVPELTKLKEFCVSTGENIPCFTGLPKTTKYVCDSELRAEITNIWVLSNSSKPVLYWSTSGAGYIQGFRVVLIDLSTSSRTEKLVHAGVHSYKLYDILPGQRYNVCLSVQTRRGLSPKSCTIVNGSEVTATDSPPSSNSHVTVILGCVLGGIVLLCLVLSILVCKLKCFKTSEQKRSSAYATPNPAYGTEAVYTSAD